MKVYGIHFEENRALINTYESLRKDFPDKEMTFVEYNWIYEAKNIEPSKWVLTNCRKNKTTKPDLSDFQDLVVINDLEYWLGDNVYFANPNDQNRIYQTSLKNGTMNKLTNESAVIIDLYQDSLYFINKSSKNAINELDRKSLKVKLLESKFTVSGWVYFYNYINIYKVKTDGTAFLKIYSRRESGSEIKIVQIKDGWVYFNVWSEDGLSKNRIKTDGTQEEYLGQEHFDDDD